MSDQTAEVKIRLGLDVAASTRAAEGLAKQLLRSDTALRDMSKRAAEYRSQMTAAYTARRFHLDSTAGMGEARAEARVARLATDDARRVELNRLAVRREYAGTPAHLAGLRSDAALQAERAKVEARERRYELQVAREARRTELQERFGTRIGALMHGAEHPAARFGMSAAGWAGAGVTGLAMSGFQGTAQMERLNFEFTLLTRELSGAFRPAIEWLSGALNRLRHHLEKLSGREQDMLMYGAGSLALLKAGSVASRGLFGVGMIEAAGIGLGLRGGGSAVAAALPKMAAAGELSGAATVAGPAAGAGVLRGGGWGARLGRAGMWGMTAAALYKAYNLSFSDEKVGLGEAGRLVPGPIGALSNLAGVFSDYPADKAWNKHVDWMYRKMGTDRGRYSGLTREDLYMSDDPVRAMGRRVRGAVGLERNESLIGRGARGFGEWIDEGTGGRTSFGKRFDYRESEKPAGGKGDEPHRKNTPTIPTLFDPIGTGYERVALASANMEGLDRQAGQDGFIGDLMTALSQLIDDKWGKTGPPQN